MKSYVICDDTFFSEWVPRMKPDVRFMMGAVIFCSAAMPG